MFDNVQLAPADPILGLNEAFNLDPRPEKVNLGVGVYLDEQGKIPLMRCVAAAEKNLVAAGRPHSYLGIDGLPSYVKLVRELVFGASHPAVAAERIVTVQALGGTGALKLGADFIATLTPGAKVLISDPSWENHRALFARAGFEVGEYRYYDAELKGIDFEGLLADLAAAAPGTVVVLHACCHNPTGYDLSWEQWGRVINVMAERALVPFLDMAYQGFSAGLAADGAVVSRFVDAGLQPFVSTSFSKSFGLYGERVGALHVVTADADQAARVLSQIKIVIRTNYSNPCSFGSNVVAAILGDAELRELWEQELGQMRERIKQLRTALVAGLNSLGITDMDFIAAQTGMFSYSGLSPDQMRRLRSDFGIYGTDAGRMCVAALNEQNLPQVIHAIATLRS